MRSQQLDEKAILEVAREIRNRDIRAKYLSQVCDDPELRIRLEQRVKFRRRWQFGLRSLLVFMVVASVASAFLGISINTAIRAQRLEQRSRLRAVQAAEQAQAAMLQMKSVESQEKMP